MLYKYLYGNSSMPDTALNVLHIHSFNNYNKKIKNNNYNNSIR